MSVMNTWIDHQMNRFFNDNNESIEEIREHFIKAKEPKKLRVLQKVDSPNDFSFTAS